MEGKDSAYIDRYKEVRNIATPVMQGLYEMVMKAFDNGCPNFEHPVILRGVLVNPYEGRAWKMKARGVEIPIKWFMNQLPPDVIEGNRYTIIGDLLSANLGSKVAVHDCVMIKDYQKFKDGLSALVSKHVVNINDYIECPEKDTFFIKGV